MKFGLFYELSTPRPFNTENQLAVYENAITQCRYADEIGFDSVWCVEHHFLEEYSHSSCPDMFLTAIARETQNVRLGFGIGTPEHVREAVTLGAAGAICGSAIGPRVGA